MNTPELALFHASATGDAVNVLAILTAHPDVNVEWGNPVEVCLVLRRAREAVWLCRLYLCQGWIHFCLHIYTLTTTIATFIAIAT